MYFCRLQFFVFMLLRGPAAEPSYLSLTTAFKLNVVFDIMLFISTLGCKPPSIAAEVAVGTFQTAAAAVLHCWHAHRTALAPPLYQIIAMRLVVMAINAYTGMVLGGGRVPWAEPEDLQPGFQQRLAELVAAKGLVLADMSVRRAGGDAAHRPDGGLDAASLVRALGLQRSNRDGGGSDDGEQGGREAELLAAVQRVHDIVLTRGAAAAGVLAVTGAGPPAPRIVNVWPRVLHVPSAVQRADGDLATAAVGTAAGPVTLRVRVEWPAGAQGPAGGAPGLATVLMQAGGVLLPVRVTASRLVPPADVATGGSDAADVAGNGAASALLAEYEIELESRPPRPGSMMRAVVLWRRNSLELRGPTTQAAVGAGPQASATAYRMLAPMLAVAHAAAVEELSANMADWPSDAESQLELNELVYDLSTWADAAAAAGAGAWAGGAEWDHVFGCAPLVAADEVVWSELLPHLINYCRAAGWNATAEAVQADQIAYTELSARQAGQQGATVAAAAGAGVTGDGVAAAAADAAAVVALADAATAGTAPATAADLHASFDLHAAALLKSTEFFDDEPHPDVLSSFASGTGSLLDSSPALLAPQHRRPAQPVWWQALLQVLGLSQQETPAETAAFRAFVCAWTTSLANIAQVTELFMVVALLSRGALAGQAALGGELAIVLSGCGLGAAAAVAWALLPAERWRQVALRLRVPRQLGYLVSKSLLGLGLARPPAGALAYAAGPGMLLMEGAILPGACLVSPAAAMAIACIKLPLNVLCSLRLGIAGGSLGAALIIGLRTEVLGLLTNTAFHVYLRLRYQEQAAPAPAAVPVSSSARERRWAAFIQRDRALHRVAKQLTGGRPKEEVVVGWGSWAFQGGKGGSPISVRGGRAAKHVFIIDEYKTSKTCYNCGCHEMAIKRLGGLKEGQRPGSVKVCNVCLTTWNRDVSAANVIRVLLLLKLMGFEQPTKLQRPPWPPAAAGPG
eukprot:XP_001699984.1 predicted protein [Chlamydomonas reinhardtii]